MVTVLPVNSSRVRVRAVKQTIVNIGHHLSPEVSRHAR
jgi:hypothetical protein